MRTISFRNRQHKSKLLNSPKCRCAIPAPTTLHRDLAIQSIVDGQVRSIEFVNQVHHRGHAVVARSIVVHRDDGRYLMSVVGTYPERSPEEEDALLEGLRFHGIELRELQPEEIRSEPRCSNARRIWQHRDDHHPLRERDAMLNALSEHGPQSIRELDVRTAVARDAEALVCSLACDDLVELDIDGAPIGPTTLVRARR